MSVIRTTYVPCFGSQLGSSQRNEPEPDHTMDRSRYQRDMRGNKRGNVKGEKNRFLLKVKLQKINRSTLSKKVTKQHKTPRRWIVEPAANKTKTTVSPGGAGADSDPVGEDVFFFSERPPSTALSVKEKAKLAVLRTISKMLEENQLIRQKLSAVSQAN